MIRTSERRPRPRGTLSLAAVALLLVAACGRAPAVGDAPRRLPVDVYADTGRTTILRVGSVPESASTTRAAVWLASVSPARAALPGLAPPEPAPETLALDPPAPPALEVDDDLRPPLPRTRVPLAVPRGARGTVELDVRIDERGAVSELFWAGGSRDSSLLRAALECARAMRFFPAQRAGRPVAVWCRQRFDFGGAEP